MSTTAGSPKTSQLERHAAPPKQGMKKELENDAESVEQQAQKVEKRFAPVVDFWTKINNDWIFNGSAMLAYTFLVSIFPLFLVILAIGGFVLGALSPDNLTKLENALAGGFPGGASGTGGAIVKGVLHQIHHSAGLFLIIGILGAIIGGSGLFLTLESAFGIAFRVKGRDPIPQRIMAVSMVLIYVVLVPIMVFASILPSAILKALQIGTNNPGGAFLIQALGLVVAFVSACLFFGAIYFVVPNCRMNIGGIWKGTLLAAGLLILYELAFPIYESLLLHPNSYGSLVGFAIVVLTFFYYVAFIVLLGAEVNSMAMGLRPTTKSLSAILQEIQARNVMIEHPDNGIMSETTSTQDNQQKSQGVAGNKLPQSLPSRLPAQRDYPGSDTINVDSAGTARSQELVAAIFTTPRRTTPSMTSHQRAALVGVVVAGAVAVAPVALFAIRHTLGGSSKRAAC